MAASGLFLFQLYGLFNLTGYVVLWTGRPHQVLELEKRQVQGDNTPLENGKSTAATITLGVIVEIGSNWCCLSTPAELKISCY